MPERGGTQERLVDSAFMVHPGNVGLPLRAVPGDVVEGELCCGLFSEFLHDVGYRPLDVIPELDDGGAVVTDSPAVEPVPPTALAIVEGWLRINGYDGLYNWSGECGCVLGDLQPCGADFSQCKPGYKQPPPGEDDDPGADFIVGPEPVHGPAEPDPRVEAVRRYLEGRPLAPYAAELVSAADEFGIDWRLSPVIAMLESGAGRQPCITNPHNMWGYDSCPGLQFATIEDAIRKIAGNLARHLYTSRSIEDQFCVWVGGGGCDEGTPEQQAHRQAYRDKALAEMERME